MTSFHVSPLCHIFFILFSLVLSPLVSFSLVLLFFPQLYLNSSHLVLSYLVRSFFSRLILSFLVFTCPVTTCHFTLQLRAATTRLLPSIVPSTMRIMICRKHWPLYRRYTTPAVLRNCPLSPLSNSQIATKCKSTITMSIQNACG